MDLEALTMLAAAVAGLQRPRPPCPPPPHPPFRSPLSGVVTGGVLSWLVKLAIKGCVEGTPHARLSAGALELPPGAMRLRAEKLALNRCDVER